MFFPANVCSLREFSRLSRPFTHGIFLVVLLAAVAPASAQVGSPSSCTPDEALLQDYVTAQRESAAHDGTFRPTTIEEARQYFSQAPARYRYEAIERLQYARDYMAASIRKDQGSSDPLIRSMAAEKAVTVKLLECRIAELQAPARAPAGKKASAPSGANAARAMAPASAQVGSPSSCVPDEALLQNYLTARNDAATKAGYFYGNTITMEEARQHFRSRLELSRYSPIKDLQAFIDRDAEYSRRNQGSSNPLHRQSVAEVAVNNKLLECRIAELQAPAQPPAGTQASAPSGAKGAGGSGTTPGTGEAPAAGNEQAARQVTTAGSGRSAMHCVRLVNVGRGSAAAGVTGANRVLSNGCEDAVEVTWCLVGPECDKNLGGTWTIHPGKSWPIDGTGPVRWAACHGANTVSFVQGSKGLRYSCKQPAKP